MHVHCLFIHELNSMNPTHEYSQKISLFIPLFMNSPSIHLPGTHKAMITGLEWYAQGHHHIDRFDTIAPRATDCEWHHVLLLLHKWHGRVC